MNALLLSADDLWDQLHRRFGDKGGIYKLHCFADVSSEGGRKKTTRLLGTDEEGVLYIDKAVSFVDQVVNLKKALSPHMKSSGHICGRRYWNNRFETVSI